MIRLVIQYNSHPPKTYTFDQPTITIGKDGDTTVDVAIPDDSLRDVHLTISKSEGKNTFVYTISNTANDPFCSFNEAPFGKRKLHVGDTITLGTTSILCEAIEIATMPNAVPVQPAPQPPQEEEQEIVFKKPKISIKDDYLREYDDDSETSPFRRREKGQNAYDSFLRAPKSWSMVAKFFAASIGALAIILGLFYMNVRDQAGEEEIEAARGVADVAMSLAYAQVRRIEPQSHNWSDPEFVQNNLTAVLAPNHPAVADFDAHGQFTRCPYLLRIYTGSDLTRFVVIAQPAPSLLHWLIPRASLVVDSSTMEIRKIHDLKSINRMLVNGPSTEVNKELSNLIFQGDLIPLSNLVSPAENQGFSVPKTLAMIHPGAENYVYNAPRYYPMGEDFINQIIAIMEQPSSNHDIFLVQQELNLLQRFPNFILYTSEGIEHAMQARKALSLLAPNEQFQLGYTQVNSKGKIINAHILLDEVADGSRTQEEIAINDAKVSSQEGVSQMKVGALETGNYSEEPSTMSDPFLLQLNALITSRTLTLKPIADEISGILAGHTQNWTSQFSSSYAKAQAKYARVDEEQRDKIVKALGTFIHEHKHLPATRFLEGIATTKSTPFFQDYLESVKQQGKPLEETKVGINASFREISASMSWQTLEQSVATAADLLNFELIPDQQMLVQYQNELAARVIQKLNQLLLSSDQSLKPDSFTSETHDTLARILELAWIEDRETQKFYLSEFDLHLPGHH